MMRKRGKGKIMKKRIKLIEEREKEARKIRRKGRNKVT